MRPIEYTITAVDRATQVIDRISNRVERLTQPFSRLERSVKRFGDITGINKLGKGISWLTTKMMSLLGVVLKLGAPLLALFGGGTIAGIYQMTEGWAKLGSVTERTAQIMGVSAQRLMNWRGVGDLVGIGADTMTQGLQGFQQTLQDAKWGRNQAVFGMLKMLNIDLKHTKNGVIDTEAVLYQLADRIQKVQKKDPAAAQKLAESFGVTELLPVLMNGGKALRSYQAEVKRLQGDITPAMTKRAGDFALSINKMKIAADSTKAAIADKLIPVFQPLIEKWTNFLTLNRENISDKIAKLAERLANWLDKIDFDATMDGINKFIDGCVKITKWVDKTVEKFGGWKEVIKDVGILIGVGFVANIGLAVASLVGMIAKLGIAATSVGALGQSVLSFGLGYGVGTAIRNMYMQTQTGQKFDDWLGEKITKVLAWGGNKQAQETLALNEKYANPSNQIPPTLARPNMGTTAKIEELANKTYGNTLFDRFKKSIINQESSGNYGAVNPRTGALGFAQIMPQNLIGWGRNSGRRNHGWDFDALGYDISPQQFLSSPELQHKIIDFKLKQAFDKYGVVGASRWWYSNNPNSSNRRPTPNEPSPNEYAEKVLERMQGSSRVSSQDYLNKALGGIGNGAGNAQSAPLNVSVNTVVHPNGSSTTKVATPQGVKISRNEPGNGYLT